LYTGLILAFFVGVIVLHFSIHLPGTLLLRENLAPVQHYSGACATLQIE
jgi:hypothetical protein